MTTHDRFIAKFVVDDITGCWNWTASTQSSGYGQFACNGRRSYLAHRYSYEHAIGAIPEGLLVCHECDNPKCVNPNHLFLGTQKINMADAMNKGRLVPRPMQPERARTCKLDRNEVDEIRLLRASGIYLKDIASRFNISFQTVSDICSGRTWK